MVRRVQGNSMAPTLRSGDIVITRRRRPKSGDIVIARQNGREVIKRVAKITDNKFYLVGDNSHESQDSRHFGSVPASAILGVVMIHLPRAIAPPTPRYLIARPLALILAGVMLVMALLHLVRIDKLIPVADVALPGDLGLAAVFVCIIATAEVFALPFLLGLRLSPLARIIGGLLVVLVPLVWTLVSIWTVGRASTGQLSSYIDAPSNWLLLAANILWLLVSFWLLWLASYDKSFSQLKKSH